MIWLLAHTGLSAPHDDAMIVMRYVRNIVEGVGPVYNAGEYVFGATNPIIVVLSALSALAGMRIESSFAAIDASFFILNGWLIARIATMLGVNRLVTAALVLFYALQLHLTVWVAFGMATSLHAFFMLASVERMVAGRLGVALTLAWCTAVNRPDGFIFTMAATISALIESGSMRVTIKKSMAGAVVFGSFLTFMAVLYGRSAFQSMVAKASQLDYSGVGFFHALNSFFKVNEPQWTFIAILFAVGSLAILRTRRSALAVAIFPLVYACVFAIARPPNMMQWYNPPFYPLYLIGAACGIAALIDFIGNRNFRKLLTVAVSGWYCLLIAILVFANIHFAQGFSEGKKLLAVNKEIGRWLAANAHITDRVLAQDIGYIGFYSHRYILDKAALVSPPMIPYVNRHDWIGQVRDFAPEWVVLELYGHRFESVLNDRWFHEHYRPVIRFSDRNDRRSLLPLDSGERIAALDLLDYMVYRKIESPKSVR